MLRKILNPPRPDIETPQPETPAATSILGRRRFAVLAAAASVARPSRLQTERFLAISVETLGFGDLAMKIAAEQANAAQAEPLHTDANIPDWADTVQAPPAAAIVEPAAPTLPAAAAPPRWKRYAVAPPQNRDRPAICVVIDDLGEMIAASHRVINLPGPLTLSWFPHATKLPDWVSASQARGHEVTLHMPMQSFSNSTDWTGPNPLRVDLPEAENLSRLRAAIDAVPNTVGVNNHMGAVATKDPGLMALVAQEMNRRSMLFLDSVVIPHSQGIIQARQAEVPSAARNYFIDHSLNPGEIRSSLAQIEAYAAKHGDVIAIGHPWPATIAALEEWLPHLQAKGFALWPLSSIVARRMGMSLPA